MARTRVPTDKKPPVAKPKAAEIDVDALKRRDRKLKAIEALNMAVSKAQRAYLVTKEDAAILKKVWEAKVEDMQSLIRRQPQLPFAKDPAPAKPPAAKPAPARTPAQAKAMKAIADDAWRATKLSEIGIKQAHVDKLRDGGPVAITTLGEIEDRRAKFGDRWAMDISGLGSAAQTAIEDLVVEYFTKAKK